jgi:hypothetical protein
VPEAIERARGLGEPAAVLQLLDRHGRGCAAVAERLGVLHVKVPDTIPGSPFEAIPTLRLPGWEETSLWCPEQRTLVVAEVLGTAVPWTGGQAHVGVHIFLRAWPPGRIRERQPEHLPVGMASACTSQRRPRPSRRLTSAPLAAYPRSSRARPVSCSSAGWLIANSGARGGAPDQARRRTNPKR